MISEDELSKLIFDYSNSSKDEWDPSTFEYISMLQAFTFHSLIQRRARDIAFTIDGEVINCSYPHETEESLKIEQSKPEVWDLLGQPSKKFNYKVKYSAPLTAHILSKDIVPSEWGEEFDEEDGTIRIV